jgi:sugar lactone lactonase YvrE
MSAIRRVTQTTDILGECPLWSEAEQALYWIDIRRPAIQRWHPATDAMRYWPMPDLVGSIALCGDGRVLVASRSLHYLDTRTGELTRITKQRAEDPALRFNDGKCDRQGRFWVGTMNDRTREPVGELYRVDGRGATSVATGVRVPNGTCFSPDGRTMYCADSDLQTIFAYPLDPDTGEPGERREFARTTLPAVPDGATVDEEGFVWLAEYGGWRVTRYAPDGGIERVVEMPVQNPTSCTFGGPDLDVLYITTASQRLSQEELAKQPLAGALLAIKPGVRGLAEPNFACDLS